MRNVTRYKTARGPPYPQRVVDPPLIPALDALLENRQMFRVRHAVPFRPTIFTLAAWHCTDRGTSMGIGLERTLQHRPWGPLTAHGIPISCARFWAGRARASCAQALRRISASRVILTRNGYQQPCPVFEPRRPPALPVVHRRVNRPLPSSFPRFAYLAIGTETSSRPLIFCQPGSTMHRGAVSVPGAEPKERRQA